MRYDKITIVINTFNSEDKIYHCLNSIESKTKVIIVENSSNTNFKNELEKKYDNLRCILAGQNLGYAKGNNLGLSNVKSEYALILNPDAILKKDTLEKFLDTANKLSDFAIVGPAKQDEYNNNDFNFEKEQVFQVKSLKGFAMFLKISEFKNIGFFDENFFIYLEEIDLCKRLIKENKKIFLDKKILIDHVGGSSHNETINFEMELSRNWHWMWSTFNYHKKYKGFLLALIIVFPKLFSAALKTLIFFFILNKKKRDIYFCRLSGLFNSILGNKSWYRPS